MFRSPAHKRLSSSPTAKTDSLTMAAVIRSDKIRMAAVALSVQIRSAWPQLSVHIRSACTPRIHDFRKAPFLSYNLPSICHMLIHLAAGVH